MRKSGLRNEPCDIKIIYKLCTCTVLPISCINFNAPAIQKRNSNLDVVT